MECVFCRIVAGVEPAQFVMRWPETEAIVPLSPVVDGHILVIPRLHVRDWTENPRVSMLTMLRAAELAEQQGIFPSNLITSAGRAATQSVFHLNLHIVPRAADDGLSLPWHSGHATRKGANHAVATTTV